MPIQAIMDRLGFRTKEQFGVALGCTHGLVSQWSSGKTRPSYDMCRKLLELGATVEELFGVDCRPMCPHAKAEPEPDAMPEWARRMEARMDGLEAAIRGDGREAAHTELERAEQKALQKMTGGSRGVIRMVPTLRERVMAKAADNAQASTGDRKEADSEARLLNAIFWENH